jgi:hypothetical protein
VTEVGVFVALARSREEIVSWSESVEYASVVTPMLTMALSMILVLWEPGTPASIDTDARRGRIPCEAQDAKAGGSGSLPLAARVTERESVSTDHPLA